MAASPTQIRPTWGVSLHDVSLRAVKLDLDSEGGPSLVAWDFVDYTEEVEDLGDVRRFGIMQRGCYHFIRRHRLRNSRVFTDLRSETAFNRTVVVPPVTDESLDRILEYEAQQQIPFPLEEVFWDRRVVSIRDDGEVHATLYAVRRALVEDRLRKISKAQLPIDGLQLRPVGLHNFCSAERLLDEGTIVVDVDYDAIQVLVHHEDQSWFRCLPVGGVDYVNRLSETFQLGHRGAVRLASGDAKVPDAGLLELCRDASIRQIGEEVVRTVRYYMAARPQVRPSGVVLFESHPCVPEVQAYLKKALELPVFKPRGFRQIRVHPDVVTAGIQENFGALAKAAGLALQGIGKAEVAIRLYPLNLERSFGRRKKGYVAAVLILLVCMGIVWWSRHTEAEELRQATETLRTDVAESFTRDELHQEVNYDRILDQIHALASPARGRDTVLPLAELIVARRQAWSDGPAPVMTALRFGSAADLEKGKAEIVLALHDQGDETAALQRLQRFAESLEADGSVAALRAGQTWAAGWPTAEPPEMASGKLLRWRLVHRVYHLTLGEQLP